MIHPVVTGGFQVAFGNGQKIPVSRLTDTELLLGADLTAITAVGWWCWKRPTASFASAAGEKEKAGQRPHDRARGYAQRRLSGRNHFALDRPAVGLSGREENDPSRSGA